jgi:hypothetical protein
MLKLLSKKEIKLFTLITSRTYFICLFPSKPSMDFKNLKKSVVMLKLLSKKEIKIVGSTLGEIKR